MGAMDELIDKAVVTQLSDLLSHAGLRSTTLLASANAVDGNKLRQRVDITREALLVDLPQTYTDTAKLIRNAYDDPSFGGWMLWPVSEALVDRAISGGRDDDFDDAMTVLSLLTTRFTGEFAIRAMLEARLERALSVAETWTQHPDEHVRRLASEGTRSHLPWAKGVPTLVKRPGLTRSIVDSLYRDESEYVRRSVANHVNDLSRDDPDIAAQIATDWLTAPDDNTPRVARHAMRSLVKKGHPQALEVMGFSGAEFAVDGPTIAETTVDLGSAVHFTAKVTNIGARPARAAVDYVLHFQKARGEARPKVFKIGIKSLAPGETVDLAVSYSFHARTTRAFHLGEHAIELQINGMRFGRAAFQLVASD